MASHRYADNEQAYFHGLTMHRSAMVERILETAAVHWSMIVS